LELKHADDAHYHNFADGVDMVFGQVLGQRSPVLFLQQAFHLKSVQFIGHLLFHIANPPAVIGHILNGQYVVKMVLFHDGHEAEVDQFVSCVVDELEEV
jgi:hypothetical protein